MDTEIHQAEERLRAAMLTGDVSELDALIDDRLVFIGPDGGAYTKEDDLELHRSGAERVTRARIAACGRASATAGRISAFNPGQNPALQPGPRRSRRVRAARHAPKRRFRT